MPKYRSKYEYSCPFGRPRHVWSSVGAQGAMHLHISDCGEEHERKYGERYSGGIEIHYRTPPSNRAPDHDQCWLLKGPCWHDGSSLAATEHWIPLWLASPEDHDRMFHLLEAELEERVPFAGSDCTAC